MKNKKIIKASYPGTGSTILANIINGLVCPNKPIKISFGDFPAGFSVLKTHFYDKKEDTIDGELGIDHWLEISSE